MTTRLRVRNIDAFTIGVAFLSAASLTSACHEGGDSQYPGYQLVPAVAVSKNEPPPYCQLRGSVVSTQETEGAYTDLQKKAAAIGATHVVLDGTRTSGIDWGYRVKNELFGRAYWCPPPPGYPPAQASPASPAPAPNAAPPPAASNFVICNPACASGYACVNGTCTAACSPPCGANQVCSPDRVCRAR